MMDCEDRQRRVGTLTVQGKVFSAGRDRRDKMARTLGTHDFRRLEGQDRAIPGLIGTCAGTNIHDCPGISQCGVDVGRDPGISTDHVKDVLSGAGHAGRRGHAATIAWWTASSTAAGRRKTSTRQIAPSLTDTSSAAST